MIDADELGPAMIVSRIEAARRQLETALRLWFAEGDAVSTHSLACSAHEILHDLNRNAGGPKLLFDSPAIETSRRNEIIKALKAEMNFFKHADGRRKKQNQKPKPGDEISLRPESTFIFLLAAVSAVELHGLRLTDTEKAFVLWCCLHRPSCVEPGHLKHFQSTIPIDEAARLRRLSRIDLFQKVVKRPRAIGRLS